MTRTFPDFGTVGQQTTQPDIDLTELAARIGALTTLRRSGRLLIYDGFDTLSGWTINVGGGTGFAQSDPTFSFRGSNSLKAAPGSANISLNRAAPILKYSKLGIEATIAPSLLVDYTFSIGLITRLGLVGQITNGFNFNVATLDITHSGNGVTTLGNYGGFSLTTPLQWINMKMVIEMTGYHATHFFFNELDFETDLLGQSSSGPSSTGIEIFLKLTRNSAGQQLQPTYYNDLLLTADEP